jgi:hypothetical protein
MTFEPRADGLRRSPLAFEQVADVRPVAEASAACPSACQDPRAREAFGDDAIAMRRAQTLPLCPSD